MSMAAAAAAAAATACSVLFCSLFYSILRCKSNRFRQWFDWLVWVELGEGDSCATLLDVEYFKWIHGELEGAKHWDSLGQCPLKAVTVAKQGRACVHMSCCFLWWWWCSVRPIGPILVTVVIVAVSLPLFLLQIIWIVSLLLLLSFVPLDGWRCLILSLSFFFALFHPLFFLLLCLLVCVCVFSIISYCALYSLFLSIQCRK